MASYTFVGGPGNDNDYDLSTFITNRQLHFNRKGPASASFNIDGRNEKASEIVELEHDLKIYRDGTKIFRGTIAPASDSIGETHRVQMAAIDRRGRLEHRLVHDGWTTEYFSTAQHTIAWNLINASQGLTNGAMQMSNGNAIGTNTVRDHGFNVGDRISDVIDTMADTDDGFDWEVDPDNLKFHTWGPKRGTAKTEPLDYGGAVFSAERRLRSGDFANAVIGMGQGFLIPETATTTDIATDPRGRWEATVSWPNVEVQAANDGRTQYLLDEISEHEYTYTLMLRHGWWQGKSQCWLGDEFPLRLRSGRMDVDTTVIVEEITITLDGSGVEHVELIAG